jgi:hypothetical protein
MSSMRMTWLHVGDIITLALVTAVGFASHGTLDSAGLRMMTTFAPLVVAWYLVAPHLGVYDPPKVSQFRQLWRPFWAMILAAPFAAWLRGLLLGVAISPIFILVLGGVSAAAILLWRLAYYFLASHRRNKYG